ncbi:MAG TPA: CHASE2 domain-containing protein, partial [Candidatus Nitrosotenuis sp.]|nr:CHASE2 domain-containing protein [Candidatus Nitrosotenuis sp.]
MGERLKGLLAPLVLGGLGALLGLLAARAEVAQKAELYLLDQRFVTRWLYPLRPVPVSPDIALVLVDEATYEHLHNPAESDPLRRHWVFWLPLYVRLASGLLEAGATAVGLDVIPQYLDPAYAAEVASALTRHAPRLVVGSYLQLEPGVDTTPVKVPHPVLSELVERAEPRNRALLNLTRDFDGAARAQSLFPLKLADPRGESEEYSWFAARLAELHRGRRFDPAQGTWGGQPLPLLAPDDPRLLINYAAPWQVFPARPMWRVLEAVERGDRQSLRRWFAGKVVLVGLGSLRDQDFAETPFSILRLGSGARLPMPGVEIHAHTLNTLLTGSYLRQVPAWAEGGSLLVLACLVAFLAGRRPVLSGLFWGAAGLGAYLAAGWLLFCRQHLWLHLMPAI